MNSTPVHPAATANPLSSVKKPSAQSKQKKVEKTLTFRNGGQQKEVTGADTPQFQPESHLQSSLYAKTSVDETSASKR